MALAPHTQDLITRLIRRAEDAGHADEHPAADRIWLDKGVADARADLENHLMDLL